MYEYEAAVHELGARVSRGDAGAAAEFQRKVGPQMDILVRRVLRIGAARTPLDRTILNEARDLGWPSRHSQVERDRLVPQVSRRVCESLVHQLRGNAASVVSLGDTLCC
jgi:hypothetical protein